MTENGRLPDAYLVTTSGGKRLTVAAGASYERLSAEHQKAFGEPLRFNSGITGYRDYDEQVYLFQLYGYPRAAIPGTSNHGWGLAGDFALVYDSARWRWMNTVGREHGWRPLNEKRLDFEPWHWVYHLALDQHLHDDAQPEEDDVSRADAYGGTLDLILTAGKRDTPEGRQASDALRDVLQPTVAAEVAKALEPIAKDVAWLRTHGQTGLANLVRGQSAKVDKVAGDVMDRLVQAGLGGAEASALAEEIVSAISERLRS